MFCRPRLQHGTRPATVPVQRKHRSFTSGCAKGHDDDVVPKPRICMLQEEEDMGVRGLARAVLAGTVAIALGSLPVAAQTVTYQTSGAFSGTGCTAVSCVFGGFTLSYT